MTVIEGVTKMKVFFYRGVYTAEGYCKKGIVIRKEVYSWITSYQLMKSKTRFCKKWYMIEATGLLVSRHHQLMNY